MSSARLLRVVIPALFVVALAEPAIAENPRINVQTFRPSPHVGEVFATRSSDVTGALRWNAELWASYGNQPLAFVDSTGRLPDHQAIQHQLSLHLTGSVRLFEWVSVGVELPIFLVNEGQASGFIPLDPIAEQALGDLRLDAKVGILRREPDEDGLGLAVDLLLGLPTGDSQSFVSDGWSFTPALIVDLRAGPLLVAANAGAHVRNTEYLPFHTKVRTELAWRFGVRADLVPEVLTALGEVYGSSSNYAEENNTYVEGLLGGTFLVGDSGLRVTLAGGRGFTRGYGSTKYRLIGRIGYALPPERDRDGDGIIDELDRCPDEPEDFDRFEDQDGCPEPDNDNDGIKDALDRCPLVPEDYDGFEDGDGCPEPDNDGDGVADGQDACPDEAEDLDGFEDEDGCPESDNDGDGIADTADGASGEDGFGACRNDPEDKDNFQDEDGCPDPDNDGDGVLDVDDDCPNDPRNVCGVKFNPCEIVITEKVYFEYDKDVIKPESYGLLDSVSAVLLSRTFIELVQVEGHTDSDGPDDYNLALSQRRAEAVVAHLAGRGVGATRLVAKGWGETKPIGSNRTPRGRAKNRRVQFIILKPSQATCAAQP